MPDTDICLLKVNESLDQVSLLKKLGSMINLKLKICLVALLPALNPTCSLASISSVFPSSLFKMTRSMILLGWLMG